MNRQGRSSGASAPSTASDESARGGTARGRDVVTRLLLVDDSEVFRERLAQAFRERGFAVRPAGDYDAAMTSAREHPPHLAVVDLKMPGRNGLELVRDLKQLDDSIHVLVLTGYGSIATAVEAVRLGAMNYLPKPADADDVLAALRRGGANVDDAT